jgi:hypothetical protein
MEQGTKTSALPCTMLPALTGLREASSLPLGLSFQICE